MKRLAWIWVIVAFSMIKPNPGIASEALQAYLDTFMDQKLQDHNIPGAVVVVVRDGQVLVNRAYGYGDLDGQRRFDPELTIFAVASVSKPFTAMAAMQLVEQGLIDLHADVNTYLDFDMEAAFGEPVTLMHLLTHTAGFDIRLLNLGARTPVQRLSLRQYLEAHPAPRVRPPGRIISYSNYGYAMVGYLVERISGMAFDRYVEAHILSHLGMKRSAFTEPDRLTDHHARAYVLKGGRHEAMPVVYAHDLPAGSLYTTGSDIARFMIAHLGKGEIDGTRLLGTDMIERMHARAYTHHERLPGWTLGFHEDFRNGRRLISHGGDLPGAHSMLTLALENELGLFVHFNGALGIDVSGDPRTIVIGRLLDRLLPLSENSDLHLEKPGFPQKDFRGEGTARHVAGLYRSTGAAMTSAEKILLPNWLFRLQVKDNGDGTLRLEMPLGLAEPTVWTEVEPMVFQRTDGSDCVVFEADSHGNITHLYGTFFIPMAFERIGWWEHELLLLLLLIFPLMAFLCLLVVQAIGAVLRRRRGLQGLEPSPLVRRTQLIARSMSVIGLVVFITLGVMMGQAWTEFETPLLPFLPVVATLTALCGVLAVILVFYSVMMWMGREMNVFKRIGMSAVAVAGLLFAAQMMYWNVL